MGYNKLTSLSANIKAIETAVAIHLWGIERSVFFNGREKWAKDFENQRV